MKPQTKQPERELTPKEIDHMYCENESMYGHGCGDKDCPHCGGKHDGNPYYQQRLKQEVNHPV